MAYAIYAKKKNVCRGFEFFFGEQLGTVGARGYLGYTSTSTAEFCSRYCDGTALRGCGNLDCGNVGSGNLDRGDGEYDPKGGAVLGSRGCACAVHSFCFGAQLTRSARATFFFALCLKVQAVGFEPTRKKGELRRAHRPDWYLEPKWLRC